MNKYKCPDCGKEFDEGNIPVECPTCGCPSDIIKANEIIGALHNMKYCPHCGSPLVSQTIKFCPKCGGELSASKSQDIDIICPDCNTIITNANEDCPICGCPSNMFIQRAKTKFVRGEILECPDCGKVFHETIPADCPNCGCPSDKFKQHIEENTHQNSSTQNKNAFSAIFITLFIVGILGGFGYLAYNKVQEAAEQARQEQYAKERAQQENERRAKEEETRKEQERKDKQRRRKLCVNKWNYRHGSYYGENILESVGFSEDGSAWCSMTYYAGGKRIRTSSFDFYYSIKGDYIYVNGEKAYYFNGNVFEDMQGRRFTEVSRISF